MSRSHEHNYPNYACFCGLQANECIARLREQLEVAQIDLREHEDAMRLHDNWCSWREQLEAAQQEVSRLHEFDENWSDLAASVNRELRLRAEAAEARAVVSECGLCGLQTLVRNPHPDAGKLERLLEVGATNVCPPCLQKALHGWSTRAIKAEARAEQMRAALEGTICFACNNRIGWQGAVVQASGMDRRDDWRTCSSCRKARAALASTPKEPPPQCETCNATRGGGCSEHGPFSTSIYSDDWSKGP